MFLGKLEKFICECRSIRWPPSYQHKASHHQIPMTLIDNDQLREIVHRFRMFVECEHNENTILIVIRIIYIYQQLAERFRELYRIIIQHLIESHVKSIEKKIRFTNNDWEHLRLKLYQTSSNIIFLIFCLSKYYFSKWSYR